MTSTDDLHEGISPMTDIEASTRLRLFAPLRAVPTLLRRPVATGSYRAEIDGLRFIAIAIVMVGHCLERAIRFFPQAAARLGGSDTTFFERAGLGVYLFFTISGFVIARQVLKAEASPLSGRFLKSYFGRRVLRIEPPYVILLVATYLALSASGYRPENAIHFDVAPHSLGVSLATSIVYLHDLVWGSYPRLFPPGWSLEVEVQFYVLAPLLFFIYFKVPRGAARIAFAAAVMFVASLVSLRVPAQVGPLHTHFSLLNFFRFFWLGIVLADLDEWIAAQAVPARVAGLAGWLGLAVFVSIPSVPDEDLVPAMLLRGVGLLALVAMFVGALSQGSSFRAFCSRPWICLIGGACYSLYLTHQQAMQAMTSVAAKLMPGAGLGPLAVLMLVELAVCVAIGLVFYAVIERTFMIKDWPQRLLAAVSSRRRPEGRVGAPRSQLGR
jgi:peptidoglycan/LPS O-acetylase OafA/YrhL